MKLNITIDCSNDSFVGAGQPSCEAMSILRHLIERMNVQPLADLDGTELFDVNGNKVGVVSVA